MRVIAARRHYGACSWTDRTLIDAAPPGFVFNIKAFGLFTHHPVVVERLPAAVKELLPAAIAEKSRIYLRDVPEQVGEADLGDAGASAGAAGRGRQARLHAVSVPALVHGQARSHPLP